MEEDERVELEYRRLLTKAMVTHGGYIFREYFEEGKLGSKSFDSFTREMVEDMKDAIGYLSDADKAAKKMLQRYLAGDMIGAWKEYFKWYPTHGEYAGLLIGILDREKKYREALEILKLCDELSGLEWDT